MRIIIFGLVSFFIALANIDAQEETNQQDSISGRKVGLIVLPIVFYSPETRLSFGAAGSYTFRFKGEQPESRPSQIQLGFAYSLNKQILSYIPFQFFVKDARYRFYGEIGYYRYIYDFYGIGPLPGEREVFSVNFPRLRLNALYRLQKNIYTGFRYWMDDYNVVKVAEGGLLAARNIAGSEGSFISGLGPVFIYDSRDHLFSPQKGWNIELAAFYNGPLLGSDFDFSKWNIDVARFFSNRWDHVWALNAYGEFTFGNVPFNQLSQLGGSKRMRGYYEGYLRDHHYWVLQGEYRLPIFWRFGGVLFGGLGGVAPRIRDFKGKEATYHAGLGLRILIDRKEKFNLRVDYAFGKNSSGFYLTVGEAF